jgi:hypothetical protein
VAVTLAVSALTGIVVVNLSSDWTGGHAAADHHRFGERPDLLQGVSTP